MTNSYQTNLFLGQCRETVRSAKKSSAIGRGICHPLRDWFAWSNHELLDLSFPGYRASTCGFVARKGVQRTSFH